MLKSLKELDELKGVKALKGNQEKEKVFKVLKEILTSSDYSKTIQKAFLYQSDTALMDSQRILIELGFHCLMLAGKVKLEQRKMYYDTLALLMDRGEINIEAIGIFEAQTAPEKRT